MTNRSGWHAEPQRQVGGAADKPSPTRRKPAQEDQGRLVRLAQPPKVQRWARRRITAGEHELCEAFSLKPPIDLDDRSLSVIQPSDPEGHGSSMSSKRANF
jgi:hypothetical protein